MKSAKLEGQQRAAVQEKIGVLEEKKTTLKDYTWLLQVLPTYPHLQSRSAAHVACSAPKSGPREQG